MRPINARPKYDGVTRAGVEAQEEREAIYLRDRGICLACRKPVAFVDFEVAHRVADTKSNRRRYGDAVVDHPLNKATTHRGACNDAMNCGFRPAECEAIVRAIEAQDGR
jgi:hypothetical protein